MDSLQKGYLSFKTESTNIMLIIVSYKVAQGFPSFPVDFWNNVETKQKKLVHDNLDRVFNPHHTKKPEVKTPSVYYHIPDKIQRMIDTNIDMSVVDIYKHLNKQQVVCVIKKTNGGCIGWLSFHNEDEIKLDVITAYFKKTYIVNPYDSAKATISNAIQEIEEHIDRYYPGLLGKL